MHRLRLLYMKQLDVRRLISNSLTLQHFLNSFLTKPQQTLLAHHRSRVGNIASDESQGATGADDDPLGNLPSPSFEKDLRGFEPVDMFDKNLVRGVLAEGKYEAPKELEMEQASSANFDGSSMELSMLSRTHDVEK